MKTRAIILKPRPVGMPRLEDFELREVDLGARPKGHVRVRNLFLSVDVSAQMGEHNYRQYGGQIGIKYVW